MFCTTLILSRYVSFELSFRFPFLLLILGDWGKRNADWVSRSKEASQVLYGGRTFDFDHPLGLLLFTSQISPSSLRGIKSISLDLGKYPYDPKSGIHCKSFNISQWSECWEAIAKMEGLQEIRVHFRNPTDGWMDLVEAKVLEPLWKVKTPLKVFEVEASTYVKTAFDMEEEGSDPPFTLARNVQFPRH